MSASVCLRQRRIVKNSVMSVQNDTIWAVYAQEVDRDHLLGYYTGEKADIIEFFQEQKRLGLRLIRVEPKEITHKMALDAKNARS